MRCTHDDCKCHIEIGDEYINWGGFPYCGTACVVAHLVKENEVEVLVRGEDKRNDNGAYLS